MSDDRKQKATKKVKKVAPSELLPDSAPKKSKKKTSRPKYSLEEVLRNPSLMPGFGPQMTDEEIAEQNKRNYPRASFSKQIAAKINEGVRCGYYIDEADLMKLTVKQRYMMFADKFCELLDIHKAAEASGLTMCNEADLLYILNMPEVNKRFALRIHEMEMSSGINRDMIVNELGLIAFSNIADLVTDEGKLVPISDPENRTLYGAVSKITIKETSVEKSDGSVVTTRETKLDMYNKLDALKTLVSIFRLADPPRLEITGPGGKDLLPATLSPEVEALRAAIQEAQVKNRRPIE